MRLRLLFITLIATLTTHLVYSDELVYVVSKTIDLNGDTLRLKPEEIIHFTDDGLLKNGSLVGSNSRIIVSNSKAVMDNISITGTWNMNIVSSKWFVRRQLSHDNLIWKNLMTLSTGNCMTHLYTERETFVVKPINKSAPIILPSNVYWHNSSIIKLLPCDFKHYSIVHINLSNNVTIDGGKFIGDAQEHNGNEGEWGHGIKCSGAQNIILRNLESEYCWGDGIDLIEGKDDSGDFSINCSNVKIENVKCSHNRRQGLSIEAAHHVKVSSSHFNYSGNPLFTAPGAGIDIEPWTGSGEKIKNITIDNCTFYRNRGPDIRCHTYYHLNGVPIQEGNVVIKNCEMAILEFRNANGAKVSNCHITKILHLRNSRSVTITKCTIAKYKEEKNNSEIKVDSCKINYVIR